MSKLNEQKRAHDRRRRADPDTCRKELDRQILLRQEKHAAMDADQLKKLRADAVEKNRLARQKKRLRKEAEKIAVDNELQFYR